MMTFWQRVKQGFRNFMSGRHGADQLSMALVWAGLAFYVLDMFFRLGLLSYLGLGCYIYAIFRMLSRNQGKRNAENQRYVLWSGKMRTQFRQARNRFKNRREFKYFKCPKCRAWLRLPHGAGDVTVTCGRCRHQFQKKA